MAQAAQDVIRGYRLAVDARRPLPPCPECLSGLWNLKDAASAPRERT